MKNLLFFGSDYKIGVSQVLTDQLIAINQSGVNVIAVGGENEQQPGLIAKIEESGIKIIRINGLDNHHDFNRLTKNLKKIIQNYNIDIVHVQNNWQLALINVVRLSLFTKNKISVVYTIHGFRNNIPIKAKLAQVIIGGALFVGANHIICMTKYLKQKFRLLSYKIDLLPLGVDEDYFINNFVEPPKDALHLIFPAQFREGKNHDMIIRAFSHFVSITKDKNATLMLPGKGELMDKMKQLAVNLNIGNQVIFPGLLTKSEIKQRYLDSNIAVVGSNSETFGQSIVEPYVIGRCVISTPVGIASEIIKNDENGYIFKTSAELAKRLLELNKDKKKLFTIGENNFAKRDRFRWCNVIKNYNRLFNIK